MLVNSTAQPTPTLPLHSGGPLHELHIRSDAFPMQFEQTRRQLAKIILGRAGRQRTRAAKYVFHLH
jgi:hypothetical protein